jgi:anthranilate phosphoribosyltransferase
MSLLSEATALLERDQRLDLQLIPTIVRDLLDETVDFNLKSIFLTAQARQGENAEELAAFAQAILPFATNPGFNESWNEKPLLDCCGTGGGGLNILNISTGVMFILAAAGVPVVKHGNRGLTKKCGSADVLEALGLRIDLKPEQLRTCLNEIGCAFIFAPAYHPAFKAIAPVRKQLATQGQRTIFNLLGPLLNPARPATQLVGVFKPVHLPLFDAALQHLGRKSHLVVYGTDRVGLALGEASSLGLNDYAGSMTIPAFPPESGSVRDVEITSAAESAKRLQALLLGTETGTGRDLLVLNAGLGFLVQGHVDSLAAGRQLAEEMIDSKRAAQKLTAWQAFSARQS